MFHEKRSTELRCKSVTRMGTGLRLAERGTTGNYFARAGDMKLLATATIDP